jgi:DNA repair protein RecO (recombination protein O)
MIVTTPAIVLRAIDFKESSKIVTLFTPEHGKFAVMVRGARKIKSKFAGYFETGNMLDVVVYLKSSRSVQNLTEVSFRQRNWRTRVEFERLAVAMATIELLDGLVHELEPSEDLYVLAERILSWLNETEESMVSVFPYIQMRLADASGFALQMDESLGINSNVDCYLNIEDGILATEPGIGLAFKLTPHQSDYLGKSLLSKKTEQFRNGISKNEIKALIRYLDVYLQHHIEGLHDRKSDQIFEQLLN